MQFAGLGTPTALTFGRTSAMNNIYKPTWLYIKQHNQTGLKYFGKTVKLDPVTYKGSGKRWLNHLRKHGNDVTTIWCQLFTDKQSLIEYAISFSKENNIVESNEWANLILEDGLWGGVPGRLKGRIVSQETRKKLSIANTGKHNVVSSKTREKISKANTGRIKSVEWRQKLSKANIGHVVTNESREKISKANKGHKLTIDQRKKQLDGIAAYWEKRRNST